MKINKSVLIAVLATLPLSASLAWAAETASPDKDMKPVATMTEKDKQLQMGKMQEKMLRMHEQMHKIMQSKDANERERLMQEHSKMMQDSMPMMQGMMSGDAKGGKMDGGMKGM